MENRTKIFGINKKVIKSVHNIMLIAMLHSTFLAPCQNMILDAYGRKSKMDYTSYENNKTNLQKVEKYNKQVAQNIRKPKLVTTVLNKSYKGSFSIGADISEGVIGVNNTNPLDDVKDNIFKFNIKEFPNQPSKAYLTYDLYGVQDFNGVARSINDNLSTGGYMIKKQQTWTSQKEEININTLKLGENKILFGIVKDAAYQYKIKNVKLEFDSEKTTGINSVLVVNTATVNYIKEKKLYIKGFLRNYNSDSKVTIEDIPINILDGEYEGSVPLSDNMLKRNFVMIKAFDNNGLLGQEMIAIDNRIEADYSFIPEVGDIKTTKLATAKIKTIIKTESASITINESALLVDKEISILKLRKVDLPPMSSGLVNVTKGGYGYRFLPDGTKFLNPVEIKIEYDQNLIPKGHNVNEIKTFYFNTQQKTWVAVKRDSINKTDKTITSATNHFTDYINGIIQTPESPETAGFTPTMMSDIKAADPAAEMTIISPPEASQKGTANVDYPIKIPAGRNGMQPNISVQYNNEAGSGWLGMGWNINVPSISIDARWGTPLLDPNYESEIYSLNGEQLMYPNLDEQNWMPNRHFNADESDNSYSTEPRTRITNAIFTPRKQGSFAKIERLGTNPSNYFWKVTDADGTINWYGGKNQVNENAVVKNEQGKIVHWGLYMTEDVHTNNVKYKYTENQILSNFTQPNENLNNGHLFYIKEINYTGINDADGGYKVVFNTTNNIRIDPSLNAKLGVKQIDINLLHRIDVFNTVKDSLIRSYNFTFQNGRFSKTLLAKITEKDKNGVEFYSHNFNYYDDVALNGYNLFTKTERVLMPNFNPSYTLGFGNLLRPSLLSSNENIDKGYTIRPSFGFEIRFPKNSNNPSKTLTIGSPFGMNFPTGKGKISLTDINGDGLDDVVYRNSNGLKFVPNTIITTGMNGSQNSNNILYSGFIYEPITNINGISDFYRSTGTTKTMFGESWDLKFRNKYYLGTKRTKSNSKTNVYFVDANDDGLMDIVKNKKVYFNHLNEINEPTFTTSSSTTPNMLITAAPNDDEWVDPQPDQVNEVKTDFDVVKVWIAPGSGAIKINDNISINNPSANAKAVYSIEQRFRTSNNRLFLTELNQNHSSENIDIDTIDNTIPLSPSLNGLISVNKGQKIYFRLHKNSEGENYEVTSNPTITFYNSLNIPDIEFNDENYISLANSNYNDSFLLSDDDLTEIPGEGQVQISWNNINVNQISDNVKFKIEKISDAGVTTILYEKNCLNNSSSVVGVGTNELSNTSGIFSVAEGDQIAFYVTVDSNVNYNNIIWKPKLIYTPTTTNTEDGVVAFTKYPIAKYSNYYCYGDGAKINASFLSCITDTTSNYTFSVKPTINLNNNQLLATDNGTFTFIVKKNSILLGKRTVTIVNGIVSVNDPSPINFYQGNLNGFTINDRTDVMFYVDGKNNREIFERCFGAIYDLNLNFGYEIGVNSTFYDYTDFSSCSAQLRPGQRVYCNDLSQFGSLNRNWGQFLYNSNFDSNPNTPFDQYSKLINEDLVNNPYGTLPSSYYNNSGCDQNLPANEYEECVSDYLEGTGGLNLPADTDSIGENDLENLVNNSQSFLNGNGIPDYAFLSMRANRKYDINNTIGFDERWLGFFDTQFSSRTSFKTGDFLSSQFDNLIGDTDTDIPDQQPDYNTGMFAINKIHKSSSRSYTAGRGKFNLSKSKSGYSTTLTDFRDINGDGYPEILYSDKFQTTTMTGGHRLSQPNINFDNLDSYTNKNLAITTSGNHTISGRAIKGTADAGGNREDIGSMASSVGVSVNANLSGENSAKEFWLDLNGDGIPEKIYKDENQIFKYKLISIGNTNGLVNYNNEKFYNLITNNNYPSKFDLGLSINFDLESFLSAGSTNGIALSLSAGYSSTKGNTDVTFADINGDGLVDIVKEAVLANDPASVRFNNGNGFDTNVYPLTINVFGAGTGNSNLREDSRNRGVSISGNFSYFHGFPVCCPTPFGFLPIIHIKAGVTLGAEASLSLAESTKDFRDLNGDGFLDYVTYSVGESFLNVSYSVIGRTNKLQTVTNPLKGSFVLDYKPFGKSYDNPNPKWVLSSVTIKDGYDKVNDGEDTYIKKYVYEKPKYDRREREFYGFETVKMIDELLLGGGQITDTFRTTVSNYYNNSYFLNGLLQDSYTFKGNDEYKKFSKNTNTYQIKALSNDNQEIITNSDLPETFDVGGTEGRRTAAVVLSSSINEIYELDYTPQMTSQVNFIYDNKARVVTYENLGNINNSTDNYTSTITYHNEPSLLNLNIINVPESITVTSAGIIVRKRTTTVNNTTGKITAIQAYLNTTDFAQTTMDYYPNGNLQKITYPQNSQNSQNQPLSYNYSYDNQFNKYVTNIQNNTFGFSSSATYNSDFDKIKQTVDIAGNEMNYNYDSFGRNTTILAPKEKNSHKPYTIKFEYYPYWSLLPSDSGVTYYPLNPAASTFVPVAVTKHYDQQNPNNDIETYTFIDGLARPIQVKKDILLNKSEDPTKGADYYEALSVSGKSQFDLFGRVTKQFHPYFEGKANNTKFKINEYNSPYFAATEYDELDRPVKTIDPEDNISTMVYSIGTDVDGTTAIKTKSDVDQNGAQHIITETYKDIQGRVISTNNVGGQNGNIWTKFKYNEIGELLTYTDAENLTTTYTYDRFGRKIKVEHPDNGTTTFTYDNVNLTALQTANLANTGTFINYEYNANRLEHIIYPEDSYGNPNIANVDYKYGTAGNQTGRLTLQKDATGEQEFDYGNMGEMITNVRKVEGPNIPTRFFTTNFDYDSWNRLQYMVYPDGEKVGYKYDLGGNLNQVTGDLNGNPYNYVERIDYDYYEQRNYLLYGNKTETFYNYTPKLRRLKNLDVKTSSGNHLIANTYKYDYVGNVTDILGDGEITNNLGGSVRHTYQYDNLNRLVTAFGNFEGDMTQLEVGNDANSTYNLTMDYNDTHGIISKTQNHDKNGNAFMQNTYDNSYDYIEGTHEVKNIVNNNTSENQAFAYDANGNMTYDSNKEASKNFYWDESNRLRVVNDLNTGAMQHYIYDADGERVLKANSDSESVFENGTLINAPGSVSINGYTSYPSAFLVITADGVYSKHYYAGSQRIVSRLGDNDASIFENCNSCKNATTDNKLKQAQKDDFQHYADLAKRGTIKYKDYKPMPLAEQEKELAEENQVTDEQKAPQPTPIYYYHPDHLGTSTALTDFNGNAYQFFLNLPFGETMAEQKGSLYYNSPYKFNGKELDEETGLYYYRARYYNPRISIWLSVDPLAEKLPFSSPYAYCLGNPISMIDPDGMYPIYIVTRSYAPFKTFGPSNAWHADNRGHTLNRNAAHRTWVGITHDTETRRTTASGKGSRSYTVDGSKSGYSETHVDNRSSGQNIDVHSYGNNAAQKGSWDIDQFTKLDAKIEGNVKKDHVLNISGTISGDDFPNQESFIYDAKGNSLWLGNFETAGDRQTGPVTDLPFENESDVNINVNVRIKVDRNGVFQGVIQKGKDGKESTISISDWNKKFKSDDNK